MREVVNLMPDTPGPWGQAQRDAWAAQREALGAFIRERRKQANLSLRQLAELTSLSNPYLSQIERGLHQPSVRVLRAISDALNLSAETLLAQAGLIDAIAGGTGTRAGAPDETTGAAEDESGVPDTERAIRADKRLADDQKSALIVVYRSMLSQPGSAD
jgi:transcriptional regulator with XRE-family HTH domain